MLMLTRLVLYYGVVIVRGLVITNKLFPLQAICQVFANKSLQLQNEVLENVYVAPSHPSNLCLNVDTEYLSSQLLTTLNRVTSDSTDLQVVSCAEMLFKFSLCFA